MSTPATHVEAYKARRNRLTWQLQRLNAEISRWEEYARNRELPPDLRHDVPRPVVSLDTLRELRAEIIGALDEWESAWEWRN